jgi:hypothetical protein
MDEIQDGGFDVLVCIAMCCFWMGFLFELSSGYRVAGLLQLISEQFICGMFKFGWLISVEDCCG